jgi:hypothetical protein
MLNTWIVFPNLDAEIYGIKYLTISPKGRSIAIHTKAIDGCDVVSRLTSKELAGVNLNSAAQVRDRLGALNILSKNS